LDFAFIGNLDADIAFDSDYFARLLEKFRQRSKLGVSGGYIHDKGQDGQFHNRLGNSTRSVAHAVQLFRRACFEEVGAYAPLPYGGPDTHAETMARMKGWEVESFPDLVVRHYRPTGSAGGMLRGLLRQGKMDYSLGYLPLFELVKLIPRLLGPPYVIGALTRFIGFLLPYCRGEGRCVSAGFMTFLRQEQKQRMKDIFVLRWLRGLSC
jgi:hypothetical protein